MTEVPKTGKPQGPIPVGEVVKRLIQDRLGAPSKVATRARAPFPPVIPEYGVVVTGRLKSHGAGSPPWRMGQWSYFVKVLTTDGLKTLWGADLKRAIAESETAPKIESLVGVQRVGHQILKLADGRKLTRNRWRVESVEYFAQHTREGRKARESKFRDRNTAPAPPAVKPRTTTLDLAQAFADRHIHNPHDRERFLEQVEDKLLSSALTVSSSRLSRDKDHEPPTR